MRTLAASSPENPALILHAPSSTTRDCPSSDSGEEEGEKEGESVCFRRTVCRGEWDGLDRMRCLSWLSCSVRELSVSGV